MTFYIYENWQAHGHQARIHIGECSFCHNGKGNHPGSSEEHGKWIGPFFSFDDVKKGAEKTGAKVSACKKCNPKL